MTHIKRIDELNVSTYRSAADKREAQLNAIPTSIRRKLPKDVLELPQKLRNHADKLEKEENKKTMALAKRCLRDLYKLQESIKQGIDDTNNNDNNLTTIINSGDLNYGSYCFVGGYEVGTYRRNIDYLNKAITKWYGSASKAIDKFINKYQQFMGKNCNSTCINFNDKFKKVAKEMIGYELTSFSLYSASNWNGVLPNHENACVGYGAGYGCFGRMNGNEYYVHIPKI